MGKYLDKEGVETLWNKAKELNAQKQDRTSDDLTTKAKGIVEAINETADAAKAAQSMAEAVEKSVEADRKGGYMRALYEAEGATYNEATGFYELNGLTDITEAQMAVIYNESLRLPKNSPYTSGCYARSKARTIFPPTVSAIISANVSYCYEVFFLNNDWEYIPVSADTTGRACSLLVYTFAFANKLRKIDYPIRVFDTSWNNTFLQCLALEHVLITGFNGGKLSFSDSPKLNYTSLRWLVDKAANTTAVTVTVHATTYGYLTGAAAPTGQVGGTAEQWAQLMADAAARNISFATA